MPTHLIDSQLARFTTNPLEPFDKVNIGIKSILASRVIQPKNLVNALDHHNICNWVFLFEQIRKSMITIIVALVEANFISKMRKDCDRIALFKKYNFGTAWQCTIMLIKDSTDRCEGPYAAMTRCGEPITPLGWGHPGDPWFNSRAFFCSSPEMKQRLHHSASKKYLLSWAGRFFFSSCTKIEQH